MRGIHPGCAGMNKRSAVPILIDTFKIDDECARIMLRVCEYFGSKEGKDMIRDNCRRLEGEVGVIDA